ncbi:hypothetical protein [Sporanaerobacter acetigenes]|uniref:hypothetical protein n=1 Tax=Sporanaerobacter acetigenes TaxID=165813 RepID=UPI001050E1B8|nr:hypothetical protein [Sporanaerobacter acetigenes]
MSDLFLGIAISSIIGIIVGSLNPLLITNKKRSFNNILFLLILIISMKIFYTTYTDSSNALIGILGISTVPIYIIIRKSRIGVPKIVEQNNPINFSTGHAKPTEKIDEKSSKDVVIDEYNFNASLYIKHIDDSVKIINSTKNPDTFFSRYDFLIERLNQLIDISGNVLYTGENPKDYLAELQNNKVDLFNSFINRYYEDVLSKINSLKTEKAKVNNANKFYDTLMKYEDYLEDNNKTEIDVLYSQLKESIAD